MNAIEDAAALFERGRRLIQPGNHAHKCPYCGADIAAPCPPECHPDDEYLCDTCAAVLAQDRSQS
jgi:hypothetical protein